VVKKYDKEYQDYQREVQTYLQQVRNGRRVPAADPQDPRFSQQADDERQAKRAGLGSFIQHGPPSPVWQEQQQMPQQQPAAPPPGSMFNNIIDWADQKRGAISRFLFGKGDAAPIPPPQPTRYGLGQ
jgi:hypothetical protein